MKTVSVVSAIVLSLFLFAAPSFGQVTSAKGSAAISGFELAEATTVTNSWHELMSTYIQVPQSKELVFDVALQTELFTDTLVKSKGGTKDESEAWASIDVRVKLEEILGEDPEGALLLGEAFYAHPGGPDFGVTYAKRTQTLMAKFGGILQSCEDSNLDGVLDGFDECEFTEEELQLVLQTMNANAFNFVAPNLDQGEYRVTVEYEIKTGTSSQAGSAGAWAAIGLGSMVVDEARFIKGDNGLPK